MNEYQARKAHAADLMRQAIFWMSLALVLCLITLILAAITSFTSAITLGVGVVLFVAQAVTLTRKAAAVLSGEDGHAEET